MTSADYEVYATYETSGNLEDKKLHKMIDQLNSDLRVSKNREFFVMSADDAYELLEAIATISGTKDKLKKIKANSIGGQPAQQVKKPPIDFLKCGIPIGAKLVFTEDPSVTVTVVSARKVKYKEEITSLSAVAGALKNYKAIQGSAFFTYNGELVTEIAEKTQWK